MKMAQALGLLICATAGAGPVAPTNLWQAGAAGDVAMAKRLLAEKANPNRRDTEYKTALHRAAMNGHLDMVELLLEHKAEINARDNSGQTALHWAARNGHAALIDFLAQHGANVNGMDFYGNTPLKIAAQHRGTEAAAMLLKHKAEVNPRDGRRTPLHLAAWTAGPGNVAGAKLLLEQGADVAAASPEDFGATPLHLAISGPRSVEMVKLLLAFKANPNAKDWRNATPLYLAAADAGVEMLRVLLEHGAEVNAPLCTGETPLFAALWNIEAAKLLLAHGADAKHQADDGSTALHGAANNGKADFAHLLLEHGADPNGKNEAGKTPLHVATEHAFVADTKVIRVLVDHGAEWTPYAAAILGEAPKLARLLDKGAEVNGKGPGEMTALHCAARHNQVKAVKFLLERGADMKAKGSYLGYTALHLAAQHGHLDVARTLLEHDAEPNALDNAGATPLHYALGRNDPALVELLRKFGGKDQGPKPVAPPLPGPR